MKTLNHKYIKVIFVFCTMLLCCGNASAKTYESDYINNSNILNNVPLVVLDDVTTEKSGFNADMQGNTQNCSVEIPVGIPKITSKVINLIKIITPIVLIVFGMIDFAMAVVASDEKKMKDSSSKFIRRTIAAVIIFFVVAIVQFGFGLLGNDDKGVMGCFDCFINGDCGTVTNSTQSPSKKPAVSAK